MYTFYIMYTYIHTVICKGAAHYKSACSPESFSFEKISTSHEKFVKMVGACFIPKCMLKTELLWIIDCELSH